MTGDAALILRARGGDELAFRRLRDRYQDVVGGNIAQFHPGAGLDWDDLRQEAAVGFFKAVRDYKPGLGSSFRNFASLCVERQLATALKAATRGKHGPLNSAISTNEPVSEGEATLAEILPAPECEQPERIFEQQAEAGQLVGALHSLTWMERQAVLGSAEGHSDREIGEMTGFTIKQIDNARQRGQDKLAGQMGSVA